MLLFLGVEPVLCSFLFELLAYYRFHSFLKSINMEKYVEPLRDQLGVTNIKKMRTLQLSDYRKVRAKFTLPRVLFFVVGGPTASTLNVSNRECYVGWPEWPRRQPRDACCGGHVRRCPR